MAGFGSQPGDFGDAGIPVPPPPDSPEQELVDDIHAIRVKYVDGATNRRQPLRLAANQALRFDCQGEKVNLITLTVITGLVFVYLYDCSANSGQAALLPDYLVGAGINVQTQQFMIPEREDYVLTAWEGAGSTATGMLIAQKI